MFTQVRILILVLAMAAAAIFAGCGEDKDLKASKASCQAFAYVMASIDPKEAGPSISSCGKIDKQNAEQTLFDMNQKCVRLASSIARGADRNIPREESVENRNSAMYRCRLAQRLIRGEA